MSNFFQGLKALHSTSLSNGLGNNSSDLRIQDHSSNNKLYLLLVYSVSPFSNSL